MSAAVLSLLTALSGARVLCVGDVMLDRYVYGHVTRISPEAPIPVFATGHAKLMPGGAGNVARNILDLGGHCTLVTLTGNDATATDLKTLLERDGQDLHYHPVVDPARRTPLKTRYIAGQQQVLRADDESTTPAASTMEQAIIDKTFAHLPEAGAVILSDYGKGCLTDTVCQAVIAAASARNIPVFVDPKGHNYTRYTGATAVTPNRAELAEASRMPTVTDAEVTAASRTLLEFFQFHAVIATRSEKGMSIVARDTVRHLPTEALEVYDVSGAGDTVVAALALATAAGADLALAGHLANVAAGVVVGKQGTATATPAEIRRALRRNSWQARDSKVCDLPDALEQVRHWRQEGLRIGFTNGCFDLLHAGHVSLLSQSRAKCDRLVVGLNTDASIQRLKGPTRPVNPLAQRSTVLAALADVDLVIPFEEDTPIHLIDAIRPDLLVKGADYTMDRVVGADIVRTYGGEVMLATLIDGLSTTRLLQHDNRPDHIPAASAAARHA